MNNEREMGQKKEPSSFFLIRIKVVPGASRNEIAGKVGDRVKVRVSAPPEDGKANRAVCAVVAKACGVKPKHVTVESGHTSAAKTLRVRGLDVMPDWA
jgi:uncharacterized protein (TIGR00251 family)